MTSDDYGYWVGSAICETALTETNEATLQNVISLFVVENLAAMTSEETAKQRAGLVGTWDCDFSAMPEYKNAKMYIIHGADGSGRPMLILPVKEPRHLYQHKLHQRFKKHKK